MIPDALSGAWDAWTANPTWQMAALLIFPLVLLIGLVRDRSVAGRGGNTTSERVLPPTGRPGLLARLGRRPREPLRIGDGTTEFWEQHLGIVAMSGGFKTTLMAQIARQRLQREPVVVITGGDSVQLETEIRAAGGWVIRPKSSPLRFNAFEGDPLFCAQGWASLFPTSSEAKVYHSAFEIATADYFATERPGQRSVAGMMAHIQRYAEAKGSRLYQGMVEGYVGIRLDLMQRNFGDWLGQELSISEALERHIPLMFVLDSAADPDLNRFAAALVWQATNYAVHKVGGFTVIVDELGRLPRNLVGNQVRTWRFNRCHLVVGTHAAEDFMSIMGDLVHTWVLGRMTASALETRQWASRLTWGTVPPENFGSHSLERGYFWLVNLERVQQIAVKEYRAPKTAVPTIPYAALEWNGRTAHRLALPAPMPAPRGSPPDVGGALSVAEVAAAYEPRPGKQPEVVVVEAAGPTPAWVPDDEQLRNVYHHAEVVGSHRLSTYRLNNRGRPTCKYLRDEWMHYALLLAVRDGLDLREVRQRMADRSPQGLTVDHLCRELDPSISEAEEYTCTEVSHLRWMTRSGNTAVQWRRKKLRVVG